MSFNYCSTEIARYEQFPRAYVDKHINGTPAKLVNY